MDGVLTLIGTLFCAFLILAASVEAVVDILRGFVASFVGLRWPSPFPKVSLADALEQADQFAGPDEESQLKQRARAVVLLVERLKTDVENREVAVAEVRKSLGDAGVPVGKVSEALLRLAATLREQLARRERLRVSLLRLLAVAVGGSLVWLTDFYVLRIVASLPIAKSYFEASPALMGKWVNITVGALAAAAGSSFWHDQLDRVRNVKAAVTAMSTVAQPIEALKRSDSGGGSTAPGGTNG